MPAFIASHALSCIRDGKIVMLELPNEFYLISLPHMHPCELIEAMHERPQGKRDFFVCVGHLDNFVQLIEEDSIPSSMKDNDNSTHDLDLFSNSHLNVLVTAQDQLNTELVIDGALQGYLPASDATHRKLFQYLEDGLKDMADLSMFGGKAYTAVAGTSISATLITNWEEAYEFGVKNDIPLVIRSGREENENSGTCSTFKIRRKEISVLRKGSILHEITRQPRVTSILASFVKDTVYRLGFLELNGRSVDNVHQVFESVHKYVNGVVEKNDMEIFLNKLAAQASVEKVEEAELDEFWKAIDIHGDNAISFARFITFCDSAYEEESSPQIKILWSKLLRALKIGVQAIIGEEIENEVTADHLALALRPYARHIQSASKAEITAFLSTIYSSDDDEESIFACEIKIMFEAMGIDSDAGIAFEELINFLKESHGDGNEHDKIIEFQMEVPIVSVEDSGGSIATGEQNPGLEKLEADFFVGNDDNEASNDTWEQVMNSEIFNTPPSMSPGESAKPNTSPNTVAIEDFTSQSISEDKSVRVKFDNLKSRNRSLLREIDEMHHSISASSSFTKEKNINKGKTIEARLKEGKSASKADAVYNRLISHKLRKEAKLTRLRRERDNREQSWSHYQLNYRRYG